MRSILIALTFVALTRAQHPQSAAILSDSRYQSGDGTFGSSYSQEDGVTFKEESDANGDRKGSYSYVDPNGQRRTVHYTAGKNGFQASGDGIPKAPPQIPPQPEYEPLPQYNPPDYRPPAKKYPQYYQPIAPQDSPATPAPPPPRLLLRSRYESEYQPRYQPEYQAKPQPEYPAIHQAEYPTVHQPEYYSKPQAEYQTSHQPEYQVRYQSEYQAQPKPEYPTNIHPEYQEKYQYQPAPQYKPKLYRPQYKYPFDSPSTPAPRPQYNEITTPSPRRFYPPGKLDFTRTPDGFSYSFNKS